MLDSAEGNQGIVSQPGERPVSPNKPSILTRLDQARIKAAGSLQEIVSGGGLKINPNLNYNELKQISEKVRRERWKGIDYKEAVQRWKGGMDRWWDALPGHSREDVQHIMEAMGIQPRETVKDGKLYLTFDWDKQLIAIVNSSEQNGIETFIKAVAQAKEKHHIKLRSAKEFARMFGSEVADEMFGQKYRREDQWQDDKKAGNQAVENSYQAAEKKARLLKKIEERDQNPDRVINGIIFDTKFTVEQRAKINQVLKMLPADLLKHVKRVHLTSEDLYMGYISGNLFKKGGEVVINIKTFNDDNAIFSKALLHEIGGHGLMDMLDSLDKSTAKDVREKWKDLTNGGLLYKDYFTEGLVSGKDKQYDSSFQDKGKMILDEFISSRMAEYFYQNKTGEKGDLNRISDQPFTSEEEAAVASLCEQTFRQWERVKNLKAMEAEKPNKISDFFRGKVRKDEEKAA